MKNTKHIWALFQDSSAPHRVYSTSLNLGGDQFTNTQMILDKIENLRQNETVSNGAYCNRILEELKTWIEENV